MADAEGHRRILPAAHQLGQEIGRPRLGLAMRLLPVPGQQVADAARRVIGDAGEHVGKPGPGIDAAELRGFEQREDHRGTLAASAGAAEGQFFLPTAMPRTARSTSGDSSSMRRTASMAIGILASRANS
jgi:hypothetical protein